jgi:hypothetical protein
VGALDCLELSVAALYEPTHRPGDRRHALNAEWYAWPAAAPGDLEVRDGVEEGLGLLADGVAEGEERHRV